MKLRMTIAYTLLILGAITSASGQAADCRSEAAARAGGQQGYERDKAAAIETERREGASSDLLGRCIGGITSVLVVPTFPSLQQVFAQAAQKMCNVARDRIRNAATLPSGGIQGLPTTSIPIPVTPAPPASGQESSPADFWNRVWR